jgi:hypothetical protein
MWLMPLYLAVTESNLFDKSDPSWVMMLIGMACLRKLVVEQEQAAGWAKVQQPVGWGPSYRYSRPDRPLAPQIEARHVQALQDRSQQ